MATLSILERAITLRENYLAGSASRIEVDYMLALLVDAKAESVGARERRFVREIERYKALSACSGSGACSLSPEKARPK